MISFNATNFHTARHVVSIPRSVSVNWLLIESIFRGPLGSIASNVSNVMILGSNSGESTICCQKDKLFISLYATDPAYQPSFSSSSHNPLINFHEFYIVVCVHALQKKVVKATCDQPVTTLSAAKYYHRCFGA